MTGISSADGQACTRIIEQESSQPSKNNDHTRAMGWALKKTKKKQRFEEKVKSFLIEKFEMRERYGNKVDPLSVSREMRLLKKDGKLYFEPAEWKTAQQIKSFFSRHSANLRQQQVGEMEVDDTEEMLTEEDMEAWESETARQDLRDAIYAEIEKPEHPIIVDEVDICQIYQNGKLKTLNISKLNSIINALGLRIQGTQGRKKSYINPIEQLVKNCSCQN